MLHDWDVATVNDLLNKSFAALAPGGLVIVHDAFLNPTKTGPLHVAEYSVLLMHASEGRCDSTEEMEQYLVGAGFAGCHYTEGAAARGIMTARKPDLNPSSLIPNPKSLIPSPESRIRGNHSRDSWPDSLPVVADS